MKIVTEIDPYVVQNGETSTVGEVLDSLEQARFTISREGAFAPHVIVDILVGEVQELRGEVVRLRENRATQACIIEAFQAKAATPPAPDKPIDVQEFKAGLADILYGIRRLESVAEMRGKLMSNLDIEVKSLNAALANKNQEVSDSRAEVERLKEDLADRDRDIAQLLLSHYRSKASPTTSAESAEEPRAPFPSGFSAERTRGLVVDYRNNKVFACSLATEAVRKARRLRTGEDDHTVVAYARIWPKTEEVYAAARWIKERPPLKTEAEVSAWFSTRPLTDLWVLLSADHRKMTPAALTKAIRQVITETEVCYGIRPNPEVEDQDD